MLPLGRPKTLSSTLPAAIIHTPLSPEMLWCGKAMYMMMDQGKDVLCSKLVQLGHMVNHHAYLLCRFEGLTKQGIPHGKGVMVMGNGGGGGFKHTARGDRQG